ncbi:MAG: DUF3492 domain-containing protein [Oligoflexia bacterium]|nr:DUF3492 domain-containing protein [Oligoflexia bacterium]
MSDVCLILEGTYPYVTGGVSSVVHDTIKRTPQISYSILYVGAKKSDIAEVKYPLPSNVRYVKEVFLYDYEIEGNITESDMPLDLIRNFHNKLDHNDKYELFAEMFGHLFDNTEFNPFSVFDSKDSWDFIESIYNMRFSKELNKPSFLDFFYQWRFTHYPLFKALSSEIPRASVYHCLSTGYAGLVGVAAKLKTGKPLLLTEHGIYSHEREIEILLSDWIQERDSELVPIGDLGFFKNWWIKLFHFMSDITYHFSDVITTLHEKNLQRQVQYGASPEKIEILPNGIDTQVFKDIVKDNDKEKKVIGFIGRVVPIKDIKTLLKAISATYRSYKNIEVLIMGPFEEDPDYFNECKQMVNIFELENVIKFTGRVNIKDYLGKIDICVLTSISEGQPMVLLECFACGIPAVVTDVGSCREMIYGLKGRDEHLGKCGEVVPFGKPDLFAQMLLKILNDEELQKKYGEVAIERVKNYYSVHDTISAYVDMYTKHINKSV